MPIKATCFLRLEHFDSARAARRKTKMLQRDPSFADYTMDLSKPRRRQHRVRLSRTGCNRPCKSPMASVLDPLWSICNLRLARYLELPAPQIAGLVPCHRPPVLLGTFCRQLQSLYQLLNLATRVAQLPYLVVLASSLRPGRFRKTTCHRSTSGSSNVGSSYVSCWRQRGRMLQTLP